MSGRILITVTGTSLMAAAALMAIMLIWVVTSDPLGVATAAATGDVGSLVRAVLGRLAAVIR